MAGTYYNMGDYNKALDAATKAVDLNPSDGYNWQSKGLALKELGRTSEADAAFAKAKEMGYSG